MHDGETEEVVEVQELAPAPQERTFTQEEVNSLVGRTRQEAAERTRRQMEAQIQKQAEAEKQAHPENAQEINAEALYQQMQERLHQELAQKQFEEKMTQVANDYYSKLDAGKDKYEDFEKVMGDFEEHNFPELVFLVSGLDNAADVMYELSKNPQKLATIDYLARRSEKKARAELNSLSQSITANQQAKAEATAQTTNSPLDRLQPSRISGSSDGMSIRDLRSQPWLKM
jgi:hypothetical protein